MAERTLSLAQQENYQFGIGTSYLCIALADGIKSRYELSHEFAQRAITIADRLNNDSLKAYSLLVITSYNYNKGNYDVAIENALVAIKIFEKKSDVAGILRTKVLMSQVYQLKNDLQKSENILQETLLLFPKIDDAKIKINTLHTLANVYGMEGKYKEALALEEVLTQAGVEYGVEPDRYKGGFVFQTERVGAFFYVLEEAAEAARLVLTSHGYRPHEPE